MRFNSDSVAQGCPQDRARKTPGSSALTIGAISDPRSDSGPERFEQLRKTLAPLRYTLLNHPLYAEVNSLSRLRTFMQIHVFAVWDFMSLVKRLQRELTCTELPWIPPRRAGLSRFANEVVLGEESDRGPDRQPISHFELYLRAMDEVGADTSEVRGFIAQLDLGERWQNALTQLRVAPELEDFVKGTLSCATDGSPIEVASSFCFGREDVIPEMFSQLLGLWRNAKTEVPHFCYYLERHIELDGDSHGPWSQEMLIALAGRQESKWQAATSAAERAIGSRIKLWDGVRAQLRHLTAASPRATSQRESAVENSRAR